MGTQLKMSQLGRVRCTVRVLVVCLDISNQEEPQRPKKLGSVLAGLKMPLCLTERDGLDVLFSLDWVDRPVT